MSLKTAVAGLFKTVADTNVFKARISGAWKDVVFVRVYKVVPAPGASGWHDVWVKAAATPTPSPTPTPTPTPPPAVVLTVTPQASSVSGTRQGAGTVYTNVAKVNVSGGTAPYAYYWTRKSYTPNEVPIPQILVNGADNSQAQFSRDMGTPPESASGVFKCTVVDANNNQGSCEISASFYSVNRPGTGGGTGGAIP